MASYTAGRITFTMPILDVPGVRPADQMRWDILDLCRACGADANLSWVEGEPGVDGSVLTFIRHGLCEVCR